MKFSFATRSTASISLIAAAFALLPDVACAQSFGTGGRQMLPGLGGSRLTPDLGSRSGLPTGALTSPTVSTFSTARIVSSPSTSLGSIATVKQFSAPTFAPTAPINLGQPAPNLGNNGSAPIGPIAGIGQQGQPIQIQKPVDLGFNPTADLPGQLPGGELPGTTGLLNNKDALQNILANRINGHIYGEGSKGGTSGYAPGLTQIKDTAKCTTSCKIVQLGDIGSSTGSGSGTGSGGTGGSGTAANGSGGTSGSGTGGTTNGSTGGSTANADQQSTAGKPDAGGQSAQPNQVGSNQRDGGSNTQTGDATGSEGANDPSKPGLLQLALATEGGTSDANNMSGMTSQSGRRQVIGQTGADDEQTKRRKHGPAITSVSMLISTPLQWDFGKKAGTR